MIGPEHPRTLAARIGLANALNDQGKYPEAISTYSDVIKLDEKVYGPEHPVTLNDRMNLATVLQGNDSTSQPKRSTGWSFSCRRK